MKKVFPVLGILIILSVACTPLPAALPSATPLPPVTAQSPSPLPTSSPTLAPTATSAPATQEISTPVAESTCSAFFYPVGFSRDGADLYGLKSIDGTAKTWLQVLHLPDLAAKTIASAETNISIAALSPEGTTLAWAMPDFSIQLIDLQTGQSLATLTGHAAVVNALLFSPDGSRLYSASSDRSVIVWNTVGYAQESTFQPTFAPDNHPSEVLGLGISPDGKQLVTLPFDGSARAWDIISSKQVGEYPGVISGSYNGAHADFSHDGQYLAIGLAAGPGDVSLYRLSDRTQVWSGGFMASFAFSPVAPLIAYVQMDAQNLPQIIFRPVDSETVSQTITTNSNGAVWRLLFSPDGATLVAVAGNQLKFWSVSDGTLLNSFTASCTE